MQVPVGQKFEIAIRPVWSEVERVRNESMNFLESQDLPDDTIQSLGMVTSELCENAVKYGSFGGGQEPRVHVHIYCNDERERVSIRVSGPVQVENNPHFRRLKQTLDWLEHHENPMQAYLEKMQDVSRRDPLDKESGLGLPRIAYEGQSILSYELNDDNVLTVSAVHHPGRISDDL